MLVVYNTYITIICVIISSQLCNDIAVKLFISCQTTITRSPTEYKCGRFYNTTKIIYVHIRIIQSI